MIKDKFACSSGEIAVIFLLSTIFIGTEGVQHSTVEVVRYLTVGEEEGGEGKRRHY